MLLSQSPSRMVRWSCSRSGREFWTCLVFVALCLQGDQGDEFFIIMEGKAIVTQCPAEGEETKEVNVLIINFHSHFLTRLVNSDPRTTLGRSLCWMKGRELLRWPPKDLSSVSSWTVPGDRINNRELHHRNWRRKNLDCKLGWISGFTADHFFKVKNPS